MSRIDGKRLLDDLQTLRTIGAYRTGVHRPTYSPEDIEARHWLAARLTEAGLDAEIDGIGNVIGRGRVAAGSGSAAGAAGPGAGAGRSAAGSGGRAAGSDGSAAGSGGHASGSDGSATGSSAAGSSRSTAGSAGHAAGSAGVASGEPDAGSGGPGPHSKFLLIGSHLETQNHAGWLDGAMGVIYGLEVARALGCGVDVAAWADEEGHYGSFLGSRSFCGLVDAHIEQGDELDSARRRIGVVTSIVGARNFRITFEGVQNHAGTTRMAIRRDAGVALVRLASAIDRRFPHVAGPHTVWTAGRMTLHPGAPSIVPGRAEMLFQFRDTDPELLDRLGKELEALVAEAGQGPCRVTLEPLSRSLPVTMDAGFQDVLQRAGEHHAPGLAVRMPSGAGHDAQILATRLPAAMLFVPSIGGISHHWAEDTSEADIVLGCAVLADAAAEILGL
jgi:beta-ureidopropionase / N-carbamoyl-L-amino-acid hydrolase